MKLNKLEQQIFDVLNSIHSDATEIEAKAVAKIALELAEKAYVHGANIGHDGVFYINFTIAESFDQFKQEIL